MVNDKCSNEWRDIMTVPQQVTEEILTLMIFMKKKFFKPAEQLTRSQLSPVQFFTMSTLHHSGPQAMSDLARVIQISKQQLTPLICRLIDSGMVKRIPDDKDRRIINIDLTPAGRQTFKDLSTAIRNEISKKLQGLSDLELEELDQMLKRMHVILTKVE